MTDKIEGLLPCPFCGGSDEKLEHGFAATDDHRWYYVGCECGAMVERTDGEDETIAAWNTRQSTTPVGDAGLRERIARKALEWKFGLVFEGESLCEEAESIFRRVNPKCLKAVAFADEILAALQSQPGAVAGDARSAEPLMVPRYPTEAMMDAGLYHCSADMTHSDLFTAWTAMFDCIALDGGCTTSLPAVRAALSSGPQGEEG